MSFEGPLDQLIRRLARLPGFDPARLVVLPFI